MKPYPEYKDSGIDRIGEIPEHWNINKLKYLVIQCNDKLKSNTDYKIALENIESKTGRFIDVIENNGEVFTGEGTKFQKYDVLLNKLRPYLAKVYLAKRDGSCVSEFLVLRTLKSLEPNFLFWHLLSDELIKEINSSTYGAKMPRSNWEFIGNLKLPYPSKSEQKTIVYYLNFRTSGIDNLVSKKERLIDLLKEERAALINQAVTKGLDPNAPMKDSGIEWLGKIPEHWKMKRLKFVCTIQGRIGFKGYKSTDLVLAGKGAITLGAKHITKDNKIDLSEPVYLSWNKYYESPEIMVKKNNIVFSQRGSLGKIGLIDRDYGDVTINPSLILLKEIKNNCRYFAYYLTCFYIKKKVEIISSSTAIPMISQEKLSNFTCLIPPIKEQTSITIFIEKESSKIDQTISKIKKEIDLLKEYRTALISETVTGKIDVRDEAIS